VSGTSDSLHFTYLPLASDGQIVARVTNVQNTGSGARAGMMIRSSLSSNAVEESILIGASGGLLGTSRLTTGGSTAKTSKTGIAVPYWLKLVRSGNVLQSYYSSNGTSWTLLRSDAVQFTGAMYAGLAVMSGSKSTLNASVFDHVSVTNFSNQAVGKVTTASSVAAGSNPANATDGNNATQWTSNTGGAGQWLSIDLGASKPISRLTLTWGATYAKSFRLETSSDGITWTTQSSVSGGAGSALDVSGLNVSARFVRLYIVSGTFANYTVKELLVEGI